MGSCRKLPGFTGWVLQAGLTKDLYDSPDELVPLEVRIL